jgi:thiazole biosynthesis enzyme
MGIEDTDITRSILRAYFTRLQEVVESDVLLVGGGPAGLTCARILAERGKTAVLIERRLAPGGGMWGGGMLFPRIAVQPEARHLLERMEVSYLADKTGLLIADSIQCASALIHHACRAGVTILNGVMAEDVAMDHDRVVGLVANWRPALDQHMPVDPLTFKARCVVDGTGHDAAICQLVARRGYRLSTPTGGVAGDGAMLAEVGERGVVEHTGEVFPGLYVLGMAVTKAYGLPRMGPIFGGMMLSGEKLAAMLMDNC